MFANKFRNEEVTWLRVLNFEIKRMGFFPLSSRLQKNSYRSLPQIQIKSVLYKKYIFMGFSYQALYTNFYAKNKMPEQVK